MKNTFYDREFKKKASYLSIARDYSKQLCKNGCRRIDKMSNCISIARNKFGMGWDSIQRISSIEKKQLKKYSNKKRRQYIKKLNESEINCEV